MEIKATLLKIILFHQGENRITDFSFQTLITLKSKHTSALLGVSPEKNLLVAKFEITHSDTEILDSDMLFSRSRCIVQSLVCV